jgi:alkanesulfonate monooxygenase SsuD/methylene tetrahydromethanopterin reductase-like flavin-dependent oxidoreductase (luciferase family)
LRCGPGILSPALAARQSAAFDRVSDGRLLLNIVTGRVAARARGIGKQAYEPGRHFVADYASEPPRIAAE